MDSKSGLPCRNQPWYVVHCQKQKDMLVSHLLQSMDIITFLPQIRKRISNEQQFLSLFPGYIFIQTDFQQVPVAAINRSPGVLKILDFGNGPVPVDHQVVAAIDASLQRINALHEGYHDFQPNELVSIKSGSLRGLEAIFLGPAAPSKRVRILLHFLGNLKEVQLDVDNLEKRAEYPVPRQIYDTKRERYTRGNGRKNRTALSRGGRIEKIL